MAPKVSNAAAARARMAKRARRARFWKANKRYLGMAFLFLLLLIFLVFFTPWGPMYFWTKIQETKMADSRRMRPGVVGEMYDLATFYNATMRSDEALKCFNEISVWYHGFSFSEYSSDAQAAEEKQRKALASIRKEEGNGPPFEIDDADLKYVGMAMFYAGEIIGRNVSQPKIKIFQDLYIDGFQKKFPQHCDQKINQDVGLAMDRFLGRR